MNTIWILLSLVANLGWSLLDVKNAFLHGDLKEEVCMEAPPRFSDGFKANKVCRLQKTFYGLKHSPRHGLEDLLKLWEIGSFDRVERIILFLSNNEQLVKSQP